MKHSTWVMLGLFMCPVPAVAQTDNQCTLLIDYDAGNTLLEEGDCDTRYSPASTFKMALALMGYDAALLQDEHSPEYVLDSKSSKNNPGTQDSVDPTLWLKESVVWYSQKLTTKLGMEKFSNYVSRFNYGNMDISGDDRKNNGLTHAWLSSSLKISALEQAAFIQRLLQHKLNITEKAYEQTVAIMPTFKTANGWLVKGKTGTGTHPVDNSFFAKEWPHGWFVGWAEKEGHTIIFVKLLLDQDFTRKRLGLIAREDFLKEFPQLLAEQ